MSANLVHYKHIDPPLPVLDVALEHLELVSSIDLEGVIENKNLRIADNQTAFVELDVLLLHVFYGYRAVLALLFYQDYFALEYDQGFHFVFFDNSVFVYMAAVFCLKGHKRFLALVDNNSCLTKPLNPVKIFFYYAQLSLRGDFPLAEDLPLVGYLPALLARILLHLFTLIQRRMNRCISDLCVELLKAHLQSTLRPFIYQHLLLKSTLTGFLLCLHCPRGPALSIKAFNNIYLLIVSKRVLNIWLMSGVLQRGWSSKGRVMCKCLIWIGVIDSEGKAVGYDSIVVVSYRSLV